jgi:hypothetical protein
VYGYSYRPVRKGMEGIYPTIEINMAFFGGDAGSYNKPVDRPIGLLGT